MKTSAMRAGMWLTATCACFATALAEPPQGPRGEDNFGPYNSTFLEGGIGQSRPLAADSALLAAGAPWSLSGWIRLTAPPTGTIVVGGVGTDECRCLILQEDKLALRLSGKQQLSTAQSLDWTQWHSVAATYDGRTARLYVDGHESAAQALTTARVSPVLTLAPETEARHFGGSVADLTLQSTALTASEIASQFYSRPDFDLIVFNHIGVGWPWQVKAWRGLLEPQDPWTLPHAKTAPSARTLSPDPPQQELTTVDPHTWSVGAWKLLEANRVHSTPEKISQTGFDDGDWFPAVVPGTVLTTLIARAVYPDPYYGLNNLAIPEALARQDYWYRTTFRAPRRLLEDRQLTLTFKGINYDAEVWINGNLTGRIKGAFVRGVFDVTSQVRPGRRNVIAVHLSPPPHPGIPHEESIAAGPGENGGNLAIDGPTFIASEGWDWIPGIRDRNTGIWQPVELQETGQVRLLDPHVVTDLPLPRTDEASVSISVPLMNLHSTATTATVVASFADISVRKTLQLPPGRSQVEFPQLRVRNPRLWWPNGYGNPDLYTLTLIVAEGGTESDSRSLRFGIRKLTYEL